MYALVFRKQVAKYLLRMTRKDAVRIRGALGRLAEDPDRRDLDVKPLEERPGYRLRVGGYRIIYERDDAVRVLAIERIAPRGDVYKG
jgi:mRNA interferase RelE/StbE